MPGDGEAEDQADVRLEQEDEQHGAGNRGDDDEVPTSLIICAEKGRLTGLLGVGVRDGEDRSSPGVRLSRREFTPMAHLVPDRSRCGVPVQPWLRWSRRWRSGAARRARGRRPLKPAPAPRPQASGFTVGISAGGAPTQEAQIGSELRPAGGPGRVRHRHAGVRDRPTIAALAARGERVQLLASFVGTLPGDDGAAKELAAWAHAFGPGGSFWRGRSDGRLAVRYIEFGNETSGGSQYDGCGPGCPDWAARATQYAERFKQSQEAIDSPGKAIRALVCWRSPTTRATRPGTTPCTARCPT